MLTRRQFIHSSAALACASLIAAEGRKPPHILLRSSWQTVNIGDIGHTPGALTLLEKHLPEAAVTLWPSKVDNGVDAMLTRRFPRLKIAEGSVGADGRPTTPALREAFEQATFFLHGSGPSLVAEAHMAAWAKATGKPYGVFGVTIGAVKDATRELLNKAAFVFCRDTISLELIKREGVKSPVMEFGPDATFAIDLRDDAAADAYLKQSQLEDRKFICAIPRLRYTPYWRIHGKPQPTEAERQRDQVSEKFKEADHAKLREAIVAFVRKAGLKVLACPEMTYQVPLAKEILVDQLPEDVKKLVVWRDRYWRPDEAASVYARALAIVSFEMHSPIISAAQGTPAFYLRQPTDTSKGQMWRDIGLNDWIFEIDDTTGEQIATALLKVHADYPAARAKMAKAMEYVGQRQKAMTAAAGKAS